MSASKWGPGHTPEPMEAKSEETMAATAKAEGKAYCENTSIHGPAYLVEGPWYESIVFLSFFCRFWHC